MAPRDDAPGEDEAAGEGFRIYTEGAPAPAQPRLPSSTHGSRPLLAPVPDDSPKVQQLPEAAEPSGLATHLVVVTSAPTAFRTDASTSAALADLERQAIAILKSEPEFEETLAMSFKRKEHALGALFARLSAADSRALHRRLSAEKPDDQLASLFSRLVAERQARLLAFLADARRREALALRRR